MSESNCKQLFEDETMDQMKLKKLVDPLVGDKNKKL